MLLNEIWLFRQLIAYQLYNHSIIYTYSILRGELATAKIALVESNASWCKD